MEPISRVPDPAPVSGAPPSAEPSLEERIGKRWTTWTGAIAILFAAGFYLQLAAGRGWLGPIGKIAIAIAGGALAILLGDRAIRRDARSLGQGLVGAGLGVVFGALYAGHALYHLYDVEPAALALVAVTAGGMLLAVRHDAAPIAVLAVLGGFLTPVLASRGGDASAQRDILCAYLTVLDLGVLGVALARRWRALEWLAFAGTWVLFAGWYHRSAEPGAWVSLAWCAGFVTIFLAVPLVHHLRRRIALSRDRLSLVLLDAGIGFAFACEILDGDGRRLAGVATVLAAAHVLLAAIVRRRLRGDGVAYSAFAVVATGFATLAAPLALRDHGIALAWALEAPVLAWLGARYRITLVRYAGAVVVLLAGLSLLASHVPLHTGPFAPFANGAFASAFAVAVAAVLYGAIARRAARRALDEGGAVIAIASSVLGALLTVGLVHGELALACYQAQAPDAAELAGLGWWLVVGATLLNVAWRRRQPIAWLLAAAAATVAFFLALSVAFLPPWPGLAFANPRFLVLALTGALLVGLRVCTRRLPAVEDVSLGELRETIGSALPPLVVIGLLAVVSSEAWQHARLGVDDPLRAQWLGQAALSCAWSGFAAVTLAVGFRLRMTALRVFALGLFGATIVKVLLCDMGRVEQIYRVTSFLVLGVLLFATSWLYHRSARRP
jgi:uncharacterized membrane protein